MRANSAKSPRPSARRERVLQISTRHFYANVVILMAACLPLFFIPVVGGIDVNGLAMLMFAFLAVLKVRHALEHVEVLAFVLVPWLFVLLLYMVSNAILGPRSAFAELFAQCAFLAGSIGIGISLNQIWQVKRSRYRLLWFGTAMSFSFITFTILTAPLENLIGLVSNITNPVTAVWHSRRVFSPSSFVGGIAEVDLASFQNRVAQHFFAYGSVIASLTLLARRYVPKRSKLYWFNLAVSGSMIAFAIVLLSGRALGELFIVVSFCGLSMLFLRASYGYVLTILFIVAASVLAFPSFSSTDLYAKWFGRFTGGNISTGRTDRWASYIDNTNSLTVLGSGNESQVDTHNIFLTLLFDAGPLSVLAMIIFCGYLLIRPFIGLRKGVEQYGLPYLLMMSGGPQIVFVIMISGGWGMPGLAEWIKFGLFIFGTQLTPGVRFIAFRQRILV